MSSHFLVFGSHPRLSLAETKAVLGGRAPKIVGPVAILEADTWDGAWLQERLAGTIKLGDVLFSCPLDELTAEKIAETLPPREGTSKLTFSVTTYGSGGALKRLPIDLKKALKETGRSVRWFADQEGQVSPAAVAKLGLTTSGYDIIVAVEDHDTAYVGITTHVQNADAWSLRDYGRPARDARNGMLPPKLARIMVNLGMGTHAVNTVLDPFCGSGTVLMEAALMAQSADIIGSDIEARQIADTERNTDWMVEQKLISSERRAKMRSFPHDVRVIHDSIHDPIDLVVTEGFLGRPLQGHEAMAQLDREVKTISELWRETLTSLAKIQPSGAMLVGIWPIYQSAHGETGVDISNEAILLGYEMVDPLAGWVKGDAELVYARADQHVKRRIFVMRRR